MKEHKQEEVERLLERRLQESTSLKDSGAREKMATGSQRDSRAGKGRFDLLPGRALTSFTANACPQALLPTATSALRGAFRLLLGDPQAFHDVVRDLFDHMESCNADGTATFSPSGGGVPAAALFRVARIYEAGAAKYDQRNWELGQPLGRYLDSGIRHIVSYLRGDRDEDHIAQAAWNFLCYEETRLRIVEGLLPADLDDLPWNPSGDRCVSESKVLGTLRDSYQNRLRVTVVNGRPVGLCTGCAESDCAAGK